MPDQFCQEHTQLAVEIGAVKASVHGIHQDVRDLKVDVGQIYTLVREQERRSMQANGYRGEQISALRGWTYAKVGGVSAGGVALIELIIWIYRAAKGAG